MAKLAKFWTDWTQRYTNNNAYWYVPKGKSIADAETIQRQLVILSSFEGSAWRDSQQAYIAHLAQEGLSEATAQDDDLKGVPMARMLAAVFSTLGFAWVNEDEAVTITPAGEKFISSTKPLEIIGNQAKRYQIANPMAGTSSTKSMEVHPVPYLLEVLLETKTVTKKEYILFCAKSKSFGDIEDTIECINNWRALGPKQQQKIIETVDSISVSGPPSSNSRRKSIYNTVSLNSSYALAFWTASGVISKDKKTDSLTVARKNMPEATQIVRLSKAEGQYIYFETKKDWMAFYGDPDRSATKSTALDYYSDTAQLDKVQQVLDEMPRYTSEQKRNYLSMIVKEETIEDILSRNMDLIEPGMTLIQRQLNTEIGRIDLFARDNRGTYTIIELKKGKTDDEVYGQLSRYLGWCKKTKARTSNVRGIIIAHKIGDKLWAAADGHDTPIELLEYDLKMSLEKAVRI